MAGILVLGGCSGGGADSADEAASGGSYVDDSGAAPQDATNGGADTKDQDAPASGDDAAPAPEANADAGGDAGDGGKASEAPRDSEGNLAAAGHAVVTTATVGVEVKDPYAVLIQIADDATAGGGWEEVREFAAATESTGASGSITVKVPPAMMDETLEHLATYGDVKSIQLGRDDVTVRVHDTAARVRAAQMMLDRAEQWLAAATTREEVQDVEAIYNERLLALDDLLSQQATDAQQTAMSTLIVHVFSPEAAPPEPEPVVEPETGFLAGLSSGWDAFYDWGSDALRVIGVLLPWLVFLALLAVATRYATRPARRRWAARVRPERGTGPTTALPPAGVEFFRSPPATGAPRDGGDLPVPPA